MRAPSDPRFGDDWAGAVCAQVGPVEAERMFFPTGPNQGDRGVAMCFTCALREPCLDLALREETGLTPYGRFGIRGGLTAPQRAQLDKYNEQRRYAA